MRIRLPAAALFALAIPLAVPAAAQPDAQTAGKNMLESLSTGPADVPTRLAVAQDYIRYLGVNHRSTIDFEAKQAEAKNKGASAGEKRPVMASMMSRRDDNLGLSIAALKALHPGPAEAVFVKSLLEIYEQDKVYYDELDGVLKKLDQAGPSAADAALFERDTGYVLQLDHALLNLSLIVMITLAEPGKETPPGGKRLRITGAQRQQLVDQLDADFGPTPYALDATGGPSAAKYLRDSLSAGYKASDE